MCHKPTARIALRRCIAAEKIAHRFVDDVLHQIRRQTENATRCACNLAEVGRNLPDPTIRIVRGVPQIGNKDCLLKGKPIVTSEGPGDLLLVGRQQVDRIVGQLEAKAITGTPNLWKTEYHAISDQPDEKVNRDISRSARRLTFNGVVDQLPLGFSGRNLQTIRRLEDGSAALSERLWAGRDEAD